MGDKQNSGQPAAQAPADPQSDRDIMQGTDQFEIFRGDFFPEADDADHSATPQGSQETPAAPDPTGTTGHPESPKPAAPAADPNAEPGAPEPGAQPTPKPDGVQFRHKTHEEAEKSYAHLLGRTTRAEQEAKKLREENEKIRAQQAERDKQARAAEAKRQRGEFVGQKYEEATKAVDELDPDDPQYHNRVARIWADTHQAIEDFEPAAEGEPDAPSASQALGVGDPESPGGQAAPEAPAGQANPSEDPSQAGGETGEPDSSPSGSPPAGQEGGEGGEPTAEINMNEVYQTMDARIKEKSPGFDRSDPAFLGYCSQAPYQDENGNPLSMEQQIDHAIDMTRQFYARKQRELLQDAGQPMDRGGPGAGGGSDDQPSSQEHSFGDIVENAVQSRVL